MERYFKTLYADGTVFWVWPLSALRRGSLRRWPLPEGDSPGAWTPRIADLGKFRYYAARAPDILRFLGPAIFEVEYRDGEVIEGDGEVFGRQARLVRRLNWDERIAYRFACDVAARVLPLWARYRPDDDRPRRALAVMRRVADNQATAAEMAAAEALAQGAYSDAFRSVAFDVAQAVYLTIRHWRLMGPWETARVAVHHAAQALCATDETAWQAQRLVQYLDAPRGLAPVGAGDGAATMDVLT